MRDMCVLYGEEFHRAWGAVATTVKTGRSGFSVLPARPALLPCRVPGCGCEVPACHERGQCVLRGRPRVYDFTGCRTVTDLAGEAGCCCRPCCAPLPPHGVSCSTARTCWRWPRSTSPPQYLADMNWWLATSSVPYPAVRRVPVVPGAPGLGGSRLRQGSHQCAEGHDENRGALAGRRAGDSDRCGRRAPATAIVRSPPSHDGKRAERTLDGYRSLLEAAGLRLTATHDLALETSLLVAEPV